MARAQVPKFGNWESEEIPYTMYFDNAGKGKKSGQIYENDPQENVKTESMDQKASEAKMLNHYDLEQKALKVPGALGPKHDRRSSIEEAEMIRLADSPLCHEIGGRRNSSNSPHHYYGGSSAGDMPRRQAQHSVGFNNSTDQSPLYPHSQSKFGGKSIGTSSPSWEKKATSDGNHGLAPSTPGRSRLRSVTRGDDSSDRGPAVPKFGEWDETDPAAAEGYTQVFDRVREEKHSEMGKVPVISGETISQSGAQKPYANYNTKGCCCFPWPRANQ